MSLVTLDAVGIADTLDKYNYGMVWEQLDTQYRLQITGYAFTTVPALKVLTLIGDTNGKSMLWKSAKFKALLRELDL